MAKKERELSPAEKTLSDMRIKLEAAKEADAKTSTDKTKAALKSAQDAVTAQASIVNRERFVRVGGNRATKARDAIRNLSNVAAPRSYNYTSADVDKLEAMLASEGTATVKKLRSALEKGTTAAKSVETFSF